MRDLRFLELIHNIEVREMSTFSQVSPQWYTSAGEEAERKEWERTKKEREGIEQKGEK